MTTLDQSDVKSTFVNVRERLVLRRSNADEPGTRTHAGSSRHESIASLTPTPTLRDDLFARNELPGLTLRYRLVRQPVDVFAREDGSRGPPNIDPLVEKTDVDRSVSEVISANLEHLA